MFNHDRRPSDLDSLSSGVSDVTSRATTIPNSWSATALQEKLKQLAQYNIRPMDDDQSSVSTTTTARDITVISRSTDAQRDTAQPSNSASIQNHHPQPQPQQPWVNPYWGPKSNSDSTAVHSQTNPPTSTTVDSSSQQHVKQLIPGSILINDQGEIDDLLWKKNNAELHSSTSSASFNPGGQYISDESGGTGGYLAPTHSQRRGAQSSSSQIVQPGDGASSNQKATSPNTTSHSSQPWVNPYWPNSNQTSSNSAPPNPSHPTTNAKPSSLKNHYVNTNPSQKVTTSTNEAWQNPYWKDNNTNNNNNASNHNNANSAAPKKSSSFPHKTPPIPTFYQRIYPPPSPVPSSTNPKHETVFSTRKSDVHAQDDDDDLPYTFASPNVVRYRAAATSAPNAPNNTSNIAPARPTPQYPVTSTPKSNAPSAYPPTSFSAPSYPKSPPPTLFPHTNTYPSSPYRYDIPALSNSVTVLTESDLNSIHNALRLLETNPNAIRVIEAPNHIPSSSSHHRQNPLATFASILKPQPSTFSHHVQFNSKQAPLFSTPSYPASSHDSLSRLTKQGKVVLI